MKKDICKNCTYYDAYYLKFASGFSRLNHGYCRKCNKNLKQNEFCNEFLSNEQKEKRRAKTRLMYLDEAITSIIEIAQILKENENMDK